MLKATKRDFLCYLQNKKAESDNITTELRLEDNEINSKEEVKLLT